MNVAVVTPTYFDRRSIMGGGERYATELAKALAGLASTTLYSVAPERRRQEIGPLGVELFPPIALVGRSWADPVPPPELLAALDGHDVVHCHQERAFLTRAALLECRRVGAHFFVTDHGGGGRRFLDDPRLAEAVSGYIAQSRCAASLGPPLLAGRTMVSYAGVNPASFQHRAVRMARRVLYVGRILPHKGIDVLIRAATPEMDLRIVGTVCDRAYVDYLSGLAAGKNVTMLHGLPDQALPREYGEAMVAVVPSVYQDYLGRHHEAPELLGIVAIEAMACGTPVICSAVGALSEVVEDGTTGFVVPPGDVAALRERLLFLLQHPSTAQTMGERGRRRALSQFTWGRHAAECLAFYKRAGASGAEGGPIPCGS